MATLAIGSWYSTCGDCNGNADPYEKSHDMVTMSGEGCGATFTEITPSTYWPGVAERLKEMRPDLPYVGALLEWGKDSSESPK